MISAFQVLGGFISIFLTLFLFSKVNQRKLSMKEIILGILVRIPLAVFWATLGTMTSSDFSYFDYPIYWIVLAILYLRPLPKTLYIFYGLFPITLWNLFYRSIYFFIFPVFCLVPSTQVNSLWPNLIDLVSIFFVLLLLQCLQYDFVSLRKNSIDARDKKVLYFTNWMMMGYYVLIQLFSYLEFELSVDTAAYRELLVVICLIIFMGVFNRLDRHLRDRLKEKLDFQRKLQLEGMKKYSHHIEELYKEVRGFRHDYSNLLTTLRLGIEEENLSQIKEVYNSVLKDSNKQFRDSKYDVGRLTNVSNSALKSLLAAKLIQAKENNIAISLEVPEEIHPQGIEIVDFITIISILCDNAIEASLESSIPTIRMAYFWGDNKQIFVIENSISEESIDCSSIFDFGFSSKGDGRGIGLNNVMKILDRYPYISLNTKSYNYTFTQVLENQVE